MTADRKTTPKMQEVKALYQPVRLLPDGKGVRVINDNLFVSLDALSCATACCATARRL